MGDELKRKADETKLDYIKRIVYGKLVDKTIDDDYSELAPLVFEKEYSSDVARRMFYGARNILEILDKEKIENIEEDSILKEIEFKKLELEKEKVRFQDQKREYRNYLKADARFEHLVDEMRKSIGVLNNNKPLTNAYIGDFYSKDSTEAVLILSDFHFGIKEKNYWNEISVEILKQRVNKLKNYTIKYAKRHNIETLHVEILGDMINGLIHLGTRVSNEEDVISQAMHCAELLAEFLNDLALYIPNIKVYSATGNHGRCVANYKESLDLENFERLIPWYLNGRLESNVKLMDNIYEDDIIIYEFLNEVIFAVHGHNDKVGTAVNELSKMFKKFPTELHLGHYHSYYEKEDHDITTTVNGTASGVDKYAKNIRKTSKAMQTLMIYNEEGRECTYKIKLN